MEEQKVNNAVKSMMDKLDKKVFRGFQRNSYVCAVKCFDDGNQSTEQLQYCIERCQVPMQQMQNYLQQEMQQFQTRLQRCAEECQDRARDSLPIGSSQPDEATIKNVQKQMESCVTSCVDSHISLLPSIEKRIEAAVKQIAKK